MYKLRCRHLSAAVHDFRRAPAKCTPPLFVTLSDLPSSPPSSLPYSYCSSANGAGVNSAAASGSSAALKTKQEKVAELLARPRLRRGKGQRSRRQERAETRARVTIRDGWET